MIFKKTTYIAIAIVLGLIQGVFSQENVEKDILLDSIDYFINRSKKETLGFVLNKKDALKAVAISDDLGIDSLRLNARLNLADLYSYAYKFNSLDAVITAIDNLGYKVSNENYYYFRYLGISLEQRSLTDSAYHCFKKAKGLGLLQGDSIFCGVISYNIAKSELLRRDYEKAEETIVDGLMYLEPGEKHPVFINSLYMLLASCKFEQEDIVASIDLYKKVYETAVHQKDTLLMANALNNLSYTSYFGGEKDAAIYYLEKGLKIKHLKEKLPAFYSMMLANLAHSNFLEGNSDRILENYDDAYSTGQVIGDERVLSFIDFYRAYYFYNKNPVVLKKALFYAKRALKTSRKVNSNDRTLINLLFLVEIDERNSLKYAKAYKKLHDSLDLLKYHTKNSMMGIEYGTVKKQQENDALLKDISLKQKEYKQAKQLGVIIVLSIVAMVLFITIILIRFNYKKSKRGFEEELIKARLKEEERLAIGERLGKEVAITLRKVQKQLEEKHELKLAIETEKVFDVIESFSHEINIRNFDTVSFQTQIELLIASYESTSFKLRLKGLKQLYLKNTTDSQKQALFLGVRESIQNTLKHADATLVEIVFSTDKKGVMVVITDNGRGFNTDSKRNGIGLKNSRDRVLKLKGEFSIRSKINIGTITQISVPF
ncbi:MAG: tetratricopeptide repeat protein [Flavobacteriaceae bacterium]|nr:tetratricopeptide repeat protein [Flavobacteriaceae bacterium]